MSEILLWIYAVMLLCLVQCTNGELRQLEDRVEALEHGTIVGQP